MRFPKSIFNRVGKTLLKTKIMKKIKFKKSDVALRTSVVFCFYFICFFFCSCSNAVSEQDSQPDKTADGIALASFAKEHQMLIDSLLKNSDIGMSEASDDSSKTSGIIIKIKENIDRIIVKENNEGSLTRISDMSAEDIVNVGSDNILDVIRGRVSADFYDICGYVIKEGSVPVTEFEVVNNNNMSFNEKVAVLLFLPVLSYGEEHEQILAETRTPASCLEKYKSSRTACGVEYAAACALSCVGGPVTAAAGVALATYQLNNCLDDALYHYRQCQ